MTLCICGKTYKENSHFQSNYHIKFILETQQKESRIIDSVLDNIFHGKHLTKKQKKEINDMDINISNTILENIKNKCSHELTYNQSGC